MQTNESCRRDMNASPCREIEKMMNKWCGSEKTAYLNFLRIVNLLSRWISWLQIIRGAIWKSDPKSGLGERLVCTAI